MNRWSLLLQGRVALAVVSAFVIGGLSVGVVLVTASAQPSASAPPSASTISSSIGTNTSTGTTSSSESSPSDDEETGRTLSGVVQQVDSGTGNFVLQDRRGATWTIVVTPNTQFVGISPGQIQIGRRLWVQGTIQSNNTLLAAGVQALRDD